MLKRFWTISPRKRLALIGAILGIVIVIVGAYGAILSAQNAPEVFEIETGAILDPNPYGTVLPHTPIVGRPTPIPVLPMRIFQGNAGGIIGVAFSPDCKSVLTAGGDGTITLWDIATSTRLNTLTDFSNDPNNSNNVWSVAFSPNGKFVLTGDNDKRARLWDIAKGKPLLTFDVGSLAESATFSPDNKLVLTGHTDGIARLWDATSELLLTQFNVGNGVTSVAFSPEGKSILTGTGDGALDLWDTVGGGHLLTLSGHKLDLFSGVVSNSVASIAFSPNNHYALTGNWDYTVRLWDLSNTKNIRIFKPGNYDVNSVAFSPDGRFVLIGDDYNVMFLWDITNGLNLHGFNGSTMRVTSVAFSPDGKYILGGSLDGTARMWLSGIGVTSPQDICPDYS